MDGGFSGDCVRKRKRRLREKNRFFEPFAGETADCVKAFSFNEDGICSQLVTGLSSNRDRREGGGGG